MGFNSGFKVLNTKVAALFCYKRLVVVNSRIVRCKKIVCGRINKLNRNLHEA